ncbi:MAG: hypothetical protein ABFC96_13425 [Thermoguttaceae bacterium]
MRTFCSLAISRLVACSSGTEPGPPPAAFTDRVPLHSCGQAKATGPDTSVAELYSQQAMACLERGRADDGAEWSVTTITTEGEPVTAYYRVAATSSQVEVFIDSSRSSFFGGPGWRQFSCVVPIIDADNLLACSNY